MIVWGNFWSDLTTAPLLNGDDNFWKEAESNFQFSNIIQKLEHESRLKRAQRRGLRPSPTVDLFACAVSEGGGELLYHFSNDRLFKLMVARSLALVMPT